MFITEKKHFKACALLVGERIDLRTLETTDRLAASPPAVSVRGGGAAVLFRYGAVVLFDTEPMEQAAFLTQLQPMIVQPYEQPESETVEVRIDPSGREEMEGNEIVLQDAAIERLQLVADILAKSVALAYQESKVTQYFDRIEPFAANLEQKSRVGRHAKELLKHIGNVLLSEQKMIGRVEMSDKPEILWERPDLERLYSHLAKEFEIRERHAALRHKLDLISRTAQTVLDLLQNQRSLRVEWYIVVLIVLEILLTLYQLFLRGGA